MGPQQRKRGAQSLTLVGRSAEEVPLKPHLQVEQEAG